MKLGIFGGTFNPIHKGHINLLQEINKKYKFDKILLIPTNKTPKKLLDNLATNEQRLTMCQLALKNFPNAEASNIEFLLGGTSYTINTVKELKKQFPQYEFYLIVGSDMFLCFDKWKDYKNIFEICNIITAARDYDQYQKLTEKKEEFAQYKNKIFVEQINIFPVSSTQIRKMIKNGENTQDLLDEKVKKYITENNIYKGNDIIAR